MGSKPPKLKPFNFSFILFLIALLFFSIIYLRQLQDEYQMPIDYENDGEHEWFDVVARELGDESMKMGLVNMDGMREKLRSRANIVNVRFDPVHEDIKWSHLFPEWIDENSPSNCPQIPMPKFQDYENLDVVVASFGCSECNEGSHSLRDVTVLHSSESYDCGAIALAQSIILSNTTKDLILLADQHISPKSLQALRASGWKIKRIQRIRSPYAEKNAYNEWNYSKLRMWQLEEYDKVMFIDSDFIVTRSLDEFFIYPQISASPNNIHIFNSGLMLVEPSECTFDTLMKKKVVVESYNGGDQGFLNEMFTWWHRLPAKINYMKYFEDVNDVITQEIPNDVYAVHYLGLKPWMCYRDYDCNWDKLEFRQFASDSANDKWWHVYDAMPKKLRQFCALTPQVDARILKYRGKAETDRFSDGHWKIQVKDPRRVN